jgi:hypothetical protein
MALTSRSFVAGVHALFFPTGVAYTVPSAGTTAREAKPGAADPAWIDLGIVEDGTIAAERDAKEIHKPLPGRKRRWKVIQGKGGESDFKFTVSEVTPLAVQLMFGTAALTGASTQFNPNEGSHFVEGWLQVQVYDGDDDSVTTVDHYVSLQLDGDVSLGEDIVKFPFMAKGLYSSLNTGSL